MNEKLNSPHPNRKRTISFYALNGAFCGGLVTERIAYAVNEQDFQNSFTLGLIAGAISGIGAGIYAAWDTRTK